MVLDPSPGRGPREHVVERDVDDAERVDRGDDLGLVEAVELGALCRVELGARELVEATGEVIDRCDDAAVGRDTGHPGQRSVDPLFGAVGPRVGLARQLSGGAVEQECVRGEVVECAEQRQRDECGEHQRRGDLTTQPPWSTPERQ